MTVKAISFDYWGTIASPNPEYSKARKKLFAKLFDTDEDTAHGYYLKVKRGADAAAEAFGHSMTPIQCIMAMVEGKKLSQPMNATEIYLELMKLVVVNPPIMSNRMHQLLRRLQNVVFVGVTSNTNFIPGLVLAPALNNLVHVKVFSDQIGASKPLPEIFQWVFNEFKRHGSPGLYKHEVMHIGDNQACDVRGADRFGFQSRFTKNPKNTEDIIDTFLETGYFE